MTHDSEPLDLNNWSSSPQDPVNDDDEQKDDYVDHSLTLRTIDKNCVNFKEYELLIVLLELRNYFHCNGDNYWSDDVWSAVKQFQEDHGLVPDCIVGPITWGKLLERE